MSTMRNADNIKYYQNLSGMCYKNYLIKSPSAIDFKISIVRSLGRIGISIKSKIIFIIFDGSCCSLSVATRHFMLRYKNFKLSFIESFYHFRHFMLRWGVWGYTCEYIKWLWILYNLRYINWTIKEVILCMVSHEEIYVSYRICGCRLEDNEWLLTERKN